MTLLDARAKLDLAFVNFARLPEDWRIPGVARPLADALHEIYVALAARARHGAYLEACTRARLHALSVRAALDSPRLAPETLTGFAPIQGLLGEALTILESAPAAPLIPLELPGLSSLEGAPRASREEPRLLAPEREVLQPALPIAEAELELPARGPGPTAQAPVFETRDDRERHLVGTPQSMDAVRGERAQRFLEDLSMMGLMRRPAPGELWDSGASIERRLLTRLDAIVLCGPGKFHHLVALLGGRPMPDPELTWGLLFLYGSLWGQDAWDQVWRLVQHADLTLPEMNLAVTDALALLPHPGAVSAVRTWLTDERPEARALAVEVLARRRELTLAETLAAVAASEDDVAVAGLRGLGALPTAPPPDALRSALMSTVEARAEAALRSALLWRMPQGLSRARALMKEGRGDFAHATLYAALGGEEDLRAELEHAATGALSETQVEAFGWYGHVGFVEPLVAALKKGQVSAASALQRITGASLDPELDPPTYPEDELPFRRRRRQSPPPANPLSTDSEQWLAWWKTHGPSARSSQRHRFGNLYTPSETLWELEHDARDVGTRELLRLELGLRTGVDLPLDFQRFVFAQRKELQAWHARLANLAAATPGGWATHSRG